MYFSQHRQTPRKLQKSANVPEKPVEAVSKNDPSIDRRLLESEWQSTQSQCEHSSGQPITIQEASYSQPKILIVDDDVDNLLVAQYIVEDLGYQATAISSGHEAVVSAIDCQPDIILLDIWLDGISGLDIIHQLRNCGEPISKIPVIAVTALAQTIEREQALLAGFSDYLSKPYMIDDLCKLIQRHLLVR